jgi:hypothetical protein
MLGEKKKTNIFLLTAILIFLYSMFVGNASATTIYDSGSPNLSPGSYSYIEGYNLSQGSPYAIQYYNGWNKGGGVDMTSVTATSFRLCETSSLSSISFLGFYDPDGGYKHSWDGTIQYSIYSSMENNPLQNIVYAGSGINAVGTQVARTFENTGGGPFVVMEYSFNLPSQVILNEDTTYWLSLHLGSTNMIYGDPYNATWWLANTSMSEVYQAADSVSPWQYVGSRSLSFEMMGEPVHEVPEPLTWYLLALGLTFLAGMNRMIIN